MHFYGVVLFAFDFQTGWKLSNPVEKRLKVASVKNTLADNTWSIKGD